MQFLALALAAAVLAAPKPPVEAWIDLTHAFDERTVYWPTETGFKLEKGTEGVTPKGHYYAAHRFSAPEHGGTHMDAPSHFYRGRLSAEEVPIDDLHGPAVVVDVAAHTADNPDYLASVEDLRAWEKRWGRIPDRAIVLVRTGWSKFWPDRRKYLGTDERGPDALAKLHFPGLHPKAARWLVGERKPRAVGIDTASIDNGRSDKFEAHVALAQANVPIFENLASLEKLPPTGATVIALPMKIKGGTGAPLRVAAVLVR